MTISSSDIKFIRSLQQKKHRNQHGLFVAEGVKVAQELLDSEIKIHSIYASESLNFLPEGSKTVSKKDLSRISGLKTPNKVVITAQIPEEQTIDWNTNIVLFLDGLKDPGNLGTIVRTAKWFGVSEIICSPDCVDAYDRKVVQSTMGALFHVNLVYQEIERTKALARENKFSIVGTKMKGTSIYHTETPDKCLLVVGSESHGIRDEILNHCDILFSIPNREEEQKVESLNVGVATAIVLSELTRKVSV